MLPVKGQNLSSKNFIHVNPLSPERPLTQAEQVLATLRFGTIGVHSIDKDVSIDKMEEALDKYYEWYPVVKLCLGEPVDGIGQLKIGKLRPTTFKQDAKNNFVIRTKRDYHEILSKTHRDFYHDREYAFAPRIYKVEKSPEENDPILSSDTGYLMVAPADHVIFDGKSHKTIRNFINGWLKDPSHKPDIPSPQTVPNTVGAFVTEDMKPVPVDIFGSGELHHFNVEESLKLDGYKRGITMDVKRVKKSDLGHPRGVTLTITMSGVQSFILTSLLLDYHKDAPFVGHGFTCPYTTKNSIFSHVLPGDTSDLIGNDVATAKVYQTTTRSNPKSLYRFLEEAQKVHAFSIKNRDQVLINERYSPYVPLNLKFGKELMNDLVSNIGNVKLLDGPIKTSMAFGLGQNNVGSINIIPTGQLDGTVIINFLAHKKSHRHRFVELYGDLFVRMCKLSEKRDITREELVSTPEYREMLSLLM